MSGRYRHLDCIYVAASAHDGRQTRICVASIRHFYPQAVVKLLPGGTLERGLREELARYWNVGIAGIAVGNWGWGFVKLEPLFGSADERFLVLDSDTAIVGDVLATWRESTADFLVDDELQSEADTHRLYYDWRKVALVDPGARPPQFVFNTGQCFCTAGVLRREDFGLLIDWSVLPPQLRNPDLFTPSDQGVLNYVINQKAMLEGLTVDRRKIMRWPLHGMEGISDRTIVEGNAPPVIVHWAGLKAPRLGLLPGADVLRFFEQSYYAKLPFGAVLRRFRACRYWFSFKRRGLSTRARLFGRRLRSSRARTVRTPMPSELRQRMVLTIKRSLFAGRGEPYRIGGKTLRFVPGTRPVPLRYRNSENAVDRYDAMQLAWMIDNISEGDFVIDIGANYGQCTVVMAARCGASGNVIAFEPNPQARDLLRRNFDLNPSVKRAAIEPFACCDVAGGEADLYRNGNPSNSALVSLAAAESAGKVAETFRVPLTTLDAYLAARGLPEPRCVKIDTEGAEIRVLKGACNLLAGNAAIFCELHPYAWPQYGNSLDELKRLVAESGRRMRYLDRTSDLGHDATYGIVELQRVQ